MTSAVFDTNIYLQAILSAHGPARACLQLVLDGKVELIATSEIFVELHNVLRRPNLVAKYPSLLDEGARLLVRSIRKKSKMVASPGRVFPFERDLADEVFINLAIEADADFLVSRDRDLLDLSQNAEFLSKYSNLKVLDPVAFLKILRIQN